MGRTSSIATASIATGRATPRTCAVRSVDDKSPPACPCLLALIRRVSFVMVLAGCSDSPDAPQVVTVLAASSTAVPVGEIARQFERQTKGRVRISSGPSGDLARQILAGAPADIYISANRQWAEYVQGEQRVQESVDLLTGRLVLVVPQGNPARVQSLSDLTADRVARVSLAGEKVPAGIYADQVLQAQRLVEPLRERKKLVRAHDARMALAYIERGEADAGIVYASDAFISDRVEIVQRIDPQYHAPILYPAIRLTGTTPNGAADAFYRYLQSPAATALFERYGFTPVGTPTPRQPAAPGESA